MFRIIWPGALPGDRFQRLFHPSIDRLMELVEDEDSSSDNLEERSDKFSGILRHMRIGKTWKTTHHNRLRVADKILGDSLEGYKLDNIKILDVGASDGITTIDMVTYLRDKLQVNIEAYLADKYLFIFKRQRGCINEYITTDGQPILVSCGPLGLLLGPTDGVKTFLYYLEIFLTKWIASGYLKLNGFRSLMQVSAIIPLINPKVLASNNIKIIEMDVFQAKSELFDSMDVVRACNVLTPHNFTAVQIKIIIDIFGNYLRQGGLLLLSRNYNEDNGEVEKGSIWRKQEGRFVHLIDFGGGSEIGELVDALI